MAKKAKENELTIRRPMIVRATEKLFYGHGEAGTIRMPGEQFRIDDESHFCEDYMEMIGPAPVDESPRPAPAAEEKKLSASNIQVI